jgi:phage tail P2-like protein
MTDLTPAERVSAVKSIAVALLPRSASAREQALLAAELARLSLQLPEMIATVWDPTTCPVELLPWLAWAVSVDVWHTDWPEATRRAVIAAAPGVHRLKGTRRAVRSALDALGIKADIVEWWEASPPGRRGTATVTAYVTAPLGEGVILSEKIQRQAIASIRASKPKSRVIAYQIGVGVAQSVGVTSDLQDIACTRREMVAASEMPEGTLGMAGVVDRVFALRRVADAASPVPMNALRLAGMTAQVQFLHLTMEVAP